MLPPGQGTRRRRRRHRSTESRRRRRHRPWSDGLPRDILGEILLKLICLADRVYFSAVCRGWRSYARGLDAPAPPRQLPWILLPSAAAPAFFSLNSGRTRPLYLPEKVRGATLCGSHDGGWVALAFGHWGGYAAVNLHSGATVPLPDRLRTCLHNLHGDNACEHPMAIHNITFSDAPSTAGCLAAAHVSSAHVSSAFNLAFWRPGMDRHWIAEQFPPFDVIQDIIYHKNQLKEGFHVLSDTEDVAVYSHIGSPTGSLVMSRSSYQVQRRADYKPDKRRLSRYLVESRGKLLMVLRKLKRGRTCRFRIFEMNLHTGGSQVSWVELHKNLPGRLLLLGQGCSRAFEVSHYNNSLQLANNICYLDDTGMALDSGSNTDMGVCVQKVYRTDRPWRRFPRRFTSHCSPICPS